jgi:RNA polymerase sigma-70 factor (ECF subfamily)
MSKTPRSKNAFRTIYTTLALPLSKFIIKKMGGNQEAVEEVFSRTIAAVWEGWNSFENKSSYFTWICRIALNKIADYYREQINRDSEFIAPFLEEIADINSDNITFTEKYALNELRASVRSCIRLLPEDKIRILFLRYWEELTIKEIAKQFNLSEKAVEGRLYRAKQSLKEILIIKSPDTCKAFNKRSM